MVDLIVLREIWTVADEIVLQMVKKQTHLKTDVEYYDERLIFWRMRFLLRVSL